MNHLNQRKSPSAPLVSKEIETDFFSSSFFFQKSREVPEVADLSISCGWGVRLSRKFVNFVKGGVLGVNEVAGGFWGVCGGRD